MPCPLVTVYKKLILINKHKRVAIKYYMIKNREFMDTLWSYQTYIYTMIIVTFSCIHPMLLVSIKIVVSGAYCPHKRH